MGLANYMGMRWDEPEEKKCWFTYCADCGWESELVLYRDELTQVACLACQSENLRDDSAWV